MGLPRIADGESIALFALVSVWHSVIRSLLQGLNFEGKPVLQVTGTCPVCTLPVFASPDVPYRREARARTT
jgi:hypothetical protein